VLVKEASEALHHDVAVAKVRVNPLALSLTVEGLAVRHRDGAPFVGWDSLYVRLAPLRLLAGDVGLAEVRLVRPSLDVGLAADGALSFQDLLPPEGQPAAAPVAEKGGGLGLSIGRLAVEDAGVTFRDATRRPAFETALGPLTIRLESFRTKGGGDSPYSLTGTTDVGETFRWTGTIRTQPLRSAGTLAFERVRLPRYAPYFQDEVPIALQDGLLDLETHYDFEWGASRHRLEVSGGKLTVDRLAMGPRGAGDAAVRLPHIEVTGIGVDALERQARVAEVTFRGGEVRVLRAADERLELAQMAPPPSSSPASSPWRWSVGAVAVSGLAVSWEDRSPPRPVLIPLTEAQLRLEQLGSEVDVTSPLALSLTWGGRGRIAVRGAIRALAGTGTVEIDAADLDLVPLAPYLEPWITTRLAGGRAGAKVRVGFDASGPAPRWTLAGDARIDALSVAEKGNEDLFRWRALEISGIDAASATHRAGVRLVRLVEPQLKAYVWEDGTTSLVRARRAPAAPQGEEPAASVGPAWRTAIGAVQVFRGRATLVDRSVTPAAVLTVTDAEARVTSLSSDPQVRSTVDVRLELADASPLRISGTLNPLDGPALRRASLERSLRRTKAATLRPSPASADEVTLAPDERARLVRAAHDAAFPAAPPKPGEAAPKPPTPHEMEERLAAAQEVPPETYRSLAAERAQRAREALLAAGLDQARLFLAQGGRAEKEKGARVYFTVR
jgi:hypothetical protein